MSLRKAKGFTIFELMVTVAIAAVLATIAIPNFLDMMARSRVNAMTEEMVNSLSTARNTAIQRRRTVVLRPDTSGWGIRMDSSAGPLLMRQAFDPRMVVTATVAPGEVSFRPSGLVQRTDVSPVVPFDATLTICDSTSRREVGKNIVISRIGRIITQPHANSSVCNP